MDKHQVAEILGEIAVLLELQDENPFKIRAYHNAAKGKLPTLVEGKDIRGVFHCHTTESDGHNKLEEMVQGAQDLKWEYIGISDHSKSSFQAHGLDVERLFAQIEKIKKLNHSKRFSTYILPASNAIF